MPKSTIYLETSGVLTPGSTNDDIPGLLSQDCVSALLELVSATDAEIVLTANWAQGLTVADSLRLLVAAHDRRLAPFITGIVEKHPRSLERARRFVVIDSEKWCDLSVVALCDWRFGYGDAEALRATAIILGGKGLSRCHGEARGVHT